MISSNLNMALKIKLSNNNSSLSPVCKARMPFYNYQQTLDRLPLRRISRNWMRDSSRHVHLVDEFTGGLNSLSYIFSGFMKYHREIFTFKDLIVEYHNFNNNPFLRYIRELTGIGLSAGVNYRFQRYIKMNLFILLTLGFSGYVSLVPGAVLEMPRILVSPDIEELLSVGMDTYVRYICSVHGTPIPCPCGNLYNMAFPTYIGSTELPFDPVNITADVEGRARGVANLVGVVILLLTLSDRVALLGLGI